MSRVLTRSGAAITLQLRHMTHDAPTGLPDDWLKSFERAALKELVGTILQFI